MELDDLYLVLRRRWRIGTLGALAAFLGLILAVPAIPGRYRSECKVLLRPAEAFEAAPAALPGSGEIGHRVEGRLRLLGDPDAPSGDDIAGRIEIKRFEGTPCLRLSAWDQDPIRSIRLLNLFVEQAAGLYAERSRAGQAPALELVPIQLATAARPSSPAMGRFPGAVAAAVFSLLVGGALALAREALAGRVYTPLDLVRRLGMPVLADIPRAPGAVEAGRGAAGPVQGIGRPDAEAWFDAATGAILRRCDGARALLLAGVEDPGRLPAIAAALRRALDRRGILAAVVEDGRSLAEAAPFNDLVLVAGSADRFASEEPSLAGRADGVILIAHAGRTRLGALAAARKGFTGSGGDVLGAILVGAEPARSAAHPPVRPHHRVRRPAAV